MRLITPPLPAVSRPSNRTTSRLALATIHSCMKTSSVCRRSSSFSYSLAVSDCVEGISESSQLMPVPAGGAYACAVSDEGPTDRMAQAASEPTLDEELLLWLGDEPPGVRAADAERVREIAAEFARGFDALAQIGPAVSVFGSARTPREHPDYALVREVTACLGRCLLYTSPSPRDRPR